MLQVSNGTPFATALNLLGDREGIDTLFAIIKGTFTLEPQPRLAEKQIPVTMAAEHHADPATSSVKLPTDISLDKLGTDVVVLGDAHAPGERPAHSMDVSVTVGPLHKTVRVFGDRRWIGNGGTYSMTTPDQFVTIPLVWERAFGGSDRTDEGPTEESRNPVGTGYRAEHGLESVDGLALPNVEDPTDLISSWKHAPTPAGLGPIDAHWEPRRSYAGTYDEQWQKRRAPYLPPDFDPRFLHIAPPGLSASGHFQGGESVDLRGLTPDGVAQFRLPTLRFHVAFHLDGTPNERPARLDTVILEPSARRFTLVWRASMSCDKKALRVSHVSVSLLSGL